MKQLYFIGIIGLMWMSSCGGKKESSVSEEQMMFQIDSVDRVTGVQRMQVSRVEETIVREGQKYTLYIERAPSDSLASVRSDLGLFADNRIVVRLTRENGSRIFSRTFTKQDFSSYFRDDNLRHFILEGMVYDEDKTRQSKHIMLAASVSVPQTDLYVPFSITITSNGSMNISRNEDMVDLAPLDAQMENGQ